MKFSVIIPVHNAQKYIREAVDSVLAQDRGSFELEVLLVENGSTDDSTSICDQYAQKSSIIKSFHMGKASAYEARQEGVRNSSGDWIVFMDADDKVLGNLITDIFETITEYLEKGLDIDVILYNAAELNTPDKKMFAFPFREKTVYDKENRHEFYRIMCSSDSLNAMWNKCINRELALKTCLSDGRSLNHGEDLLQTAAIIDNAKGIAYLDRILYLYRINEEGLTGSYHEAFLDNQSRAWEAFDEYAAKWCGDKYKEVISQRKTLTCTIGIKQLIYSGLSVSTINKKLSEMMNTDFYIKYGQGNLPDWAPEEDVFVHSLQMTDNAGARLMRSCMKYKIKSYIKARIRKNGL